MKKIRKKALNNGRVIMIGPFPPPTHGMAIVNAMIRRHIIKLGDDPIILDTSPNTLNRELSSRLTRIPKVVLCLVRFLYYSLISFQNMYISISGGYGQLYEIFFIMLGRLSRSRIYLHHHTYAYLKRSKRISKLLILIAGREAFHITLCNEMAERLKCLYNCSDRVIVLSNAVLISNDILDAKTLRYSLKRIGFLGNISDAKGIFKFLDVFQYLSEKHPNIKIHGLIAGPFEDERVERQVLSDLKDLANVSYVGPKYGSDKVDFFRAIDALLFPTKYANEAEPLTIHEAMATGLPVIAWQRGCIQNMISSNSGFVVKQQDDFVKSSVERILLWASSPSEYRRVSASAYNHFINLRKNYQNKLKNLLEQIVGH